MPKTVSKKNREKSSVPVISVLLDVTHYDFNLFLSRFQRKWRFKVTPYKDENAIGMMIDDMVIGCAFVPAPCADRGLSASALNNVLWAGAAAAVSEHKAHIMVTLTHEKDPVAANILLSKIVCSLIQQKNVLGVYLNPGLVEPSYYEKHAEEISAGDLPASLWVHINSLNEKGCFTFFTAGMNKFGKKEFEIIETKKNFIDAYYFLKELVKYTLENDITFKDNDSIGPDDDNKILLSSSKGVKIKGTVIRIDV